MEPAFWLSRWEAQQIGFHQDRINTHLETHWPQLEAQRQQTTADSMPRVFVPLCGKSRDMLWLRARGFAVLGVELSPRAVRDFFAENALQPQVSQQGAFERWEADGLVILCGDLFALRPADLAHPARDNDPHGVYAVYDRASLIALPPAMRAEYARHMQTLLPSGTPTLLITMEYPQAEMDGPPFSVHEEEVRTLFGDGHAVTRLAEADILADNARFRERGLSALREKIYLLT